MSHKTECIRNGIYQRWVLIIGFWGKVGLIVVLIASTVGCERQKPRNKYEDILWSLKEPGATRIVYFRNNKYKGIYGITYHLKAKYPAEWVWQNLDRKFSKDFVPFRQPNTGEGGREWGRCGVLSANPGYVHAFDAMWAPRKGEAYFIRAILKYFSPYDVEGKPPLPHLFPPADDDLKVNIGIYPYELYPNINPPKSIPLSARNAK